jgi:hypothetical protein
MVTRPSTNGGAHVDALTWLADECAVVTKRADNVKTSASTRAQLFDCLTSDAVVTRMTFPVEDRGPRPTDYAAF